MGRFSCFGPIIWHPLIKNWIWAAHGSQLQAMYSMSNPMNCDELKLINQQKWILGHPNPTYIAPHINKKEIHLLHYYRLIQMVKWLFHSIKISNLNLVNRVNMRWKNYTPLCTSNSLTLVKKIPPKKIVTSSPVVHKD